MTVRNYALYSLNQFKYNFKRRFQYSIQNAKEQEILNTFDNSFHSFMFSTKIQDERNVHYLKHNIWFKKC